jgi:hypothetical protein
LTNPHETNDASGSAPAESAITESPDETQSPRRQPRTGGPGLFVLALLVLAGCAVFSLWPALFAPIAADDRYWLLDTPARFDGSYLNVITGTWGDTPEFLTRGRLAPIGRLVRRILLLAVFDFSHLTSSSVVTFNGLSKLLLLALGLGCCVAFVKALRWRSGDGQLVGAGKATLVVIGVATSGLIAAGVQAHSQFRNGWISYPSLTYTTIAIVFGSAAIAVVAARRIADEKRGAVSLGLLVAIGLAIILNWFYELNYVGLPLCLFALLAFPLAPRSRSGRERLGRLVVGGGLLTFWLAMFALTRVLVSNACRGDDCYVGTTMSLTPQVVRTMWNNLLSSVPGTSRAQFLVDLESLNSSHLWSDSTPGLLSIVSVALGAAIWLIWRWASARWPRGKDESRGEARLLGLASVGAIGVGLGSAFVMSLSVQAQDLIHTVGLPYRHTVLAWVSLSLGIVLAARAVELSVSSKVGLGLVGAVALLVVVASIFTLPRNLVSTQAHRNDPGNQAIAEIHWEVVAGDLNPGGDERRCQSLANAEALISSPWLTDRLEPTADEVFRTINRVPFCTTWSRR